MSETPARGSLPADLVDFVEALNECGAKFLIVGGHAVGFHGHAGATEDFDAVAEALRAFR